MQYRSTNERVLEALRALSAVEAMGAVATAAETVVDAATAAIVSAAPDPELEHSDKRTPRFTLKGQTVRAKCVDVYDGDTAQFNFRPAPGAPIARFSCRFLGYNCAEIKTSDPAEKAAAVRARDALRAKILGSMVTLLLDDFDKYGRPLVTVIAGGEDVNEFMLAHGYGKPYSGAGEREGGAW